MVPSFAEDPEGADEGDRPKPVTQATGFGPRHLSLDRRSHRNAPARDGQLIVDDSYRRRRWRRSKYVGDEYVRSVGGRVCTATVRPR